MILGRTRIEAELRTGAIFCSPAPTHIEATHIDLTIGRYYYVPKHPTQLRHIEYPGRWVGSEWLPAYTQTVPVIDLAITNPADLYELHDAEDTGGALVIPPYTMVLAHTQQAAGSTVPWLDPWIDTRSTMARLGLTGHISAGKGDPGFCGIWTLEVWHCHPWIAVVPVGVRIASLAFRMVEGNDTTYPEGARYNYSLEQWTPERMLPRKGNLA